MCFYSLQPIMNKFVARISHFHIRHGNVWISRLLKQGEFLVLTAFRTSAGSVRWGWLHCHFWANSITVEKENNNKGLAM